MITIRQARTKKNKMGLEQMGIQLFEGAETQVTPAVINNKVFIGYDEKKEADTIKVIEKHYGRPLTDLSFYGSLILRIQHMPFTIDPSNGEDLLKLGVLKAQGKLAPSASEQDDPNKDYQFVMFDERQESAIKLSVYQKRAKAASYLNTILEKDPDYLLALCHYNCNYSTGISSKEGAFVKLSELIDGKLSELKEVTVDSFLKSLDPVYGGDINKDWLMARVLVASALHYNILRYSSQKGYFYNVALPDGENVSYGRNLDQVTDYLLQIHNSDHLGTGTDKDHPWAIRYQLSLKGVKFS